MKTFDEARDILFMDSCIWKEAHWKHLETPPSLVPLSGLTDLACAWYNLALALALEW